MYDIHLCHTQESGNYSLIGLFSTFWCWLFISAFSAKVNIWKGGKKKQKVISLFHKTTNMWILRHKTDLLI